MFVRSTDLGALAVSRLSQDLLILKSKREERVICYRKQAGISNVQVFDIGLTMGLERSAVCTISSKQLHRMQVKSENKREKSQ